MFRTVLFPFDQSRAAMDTAATVLQLVQPAFVIGDVADEIEADLIVMGTRGINLEQAGTSTAARVIQLAPCPVLVVP